ncbi:MAG TPA: hypothetical protein VLA88_01420 [Candidatus Saccharimonadales bacterium]|nr:hypothetical protein [Candidatus Saccharimonadales bacterium]
MSSPESHHSNPAVAEQGNERSFMHEKWMENLEPILDKMDKAHLEELSNLNAKFDAAYEEALREARNTGEAWYVSMGASPEDALARVEAETSTREYERRLMRGILEDNTEDIDRILPHFTVDLDPNDPDYDDMVDEARQALENVATMPRDEWWGDEDENGEDAGNGVFHDVARSFIPNYDELRAAEREGDPGAPDDDPDRPDPGPAPERGTVYLSENAQGTAVVPTNPEVAARAARQNSLEQNTSVLDQRESVTNERYGAHVGDKMVFTQQSPDGTTLVISYEIMGFPAQLPGETNPPVTLHRTEQRFQGNRPVTPAVDSTYVFAADHVQNLGRDVQHFNDGGQRAVDLNEYWRMHHAEMQPATATPEQKKGLKNKIGRVLGAAALLAVGFEAGRKGHDIAAAMDAVKDLFHIHGASSVWVEGAQDNGMIGGIDGIPNPIEVPTPNILPDPSTLTPEQLHNFNALTAPIHNNMGGFELYHNLGLGQDAWNAQSHDLVDKFPKDFFTFDSGVHAGEVGLRHPGKPLSPQAALYIARVNHLI